MRAAWEAFRCSEGRGGALEAVKRPRKLGVEAVTILLIADALRWLVLGGRRRERGVEDEAALFLESLRVMEVGEVIGGADRCVVVGPDMALMI